jgi:hypothetical protein
VIDVFVSFQQTADGYFNGSIQNLNSHYKRSDDAIFKNDAFNIPFISNSVTYLKAE